MSVMASRPVLRWVVPAGVLLAVLGGGAATTALTASADSSLPPRSAAQLLVDLQTARLDGVSGTVVERADLGLPTLPGVMGGDGSSQLNSLVTGSHTLRVWYSGQDKARVALLGAVSETDVIANGTDGWVWASSTNSATHYRLGKDHAGPPPTGKLPTDMPKTPQEAADRILALVSPTTSVSTDGSALVAGHKAYELVLAPKDAASLVAEVRIAIDGKAHVPTRVEVFAKGHDPAVFEIGFTQVSFTRPNDSVFQFSPPPGAKITEATPGTRPDGSAAKPDGSAAKPADQPKSAVVGTGWTSVLVVRMPEPEPGAQPDQRGPGPRSAAGLNEFVAKLPQVHGSFGTGHVLQSRLFSVLVLDDGRVLVGAVSPERLVAAASDPAAALK
jgi:outer membrane lipoprotein-sorting protein